MKRTFAKIAAITLSTALTGPIQANSVRDGRPDYYEFDWEYKNNRIIESTVCDRYSGLDWKNCRRYANWYFSEKCWEYRNELRHKSGDVRREILKKRDRYCDAKRRITTL
ncbi:hypothetical protein SAMN05216429_106138 [Marinobacter persicus]|uniref:Uncharacterized protein n=1 Tax=Marinobacter persicus TaxID=930118 RepID=A0A1I3ULK9_9GAMM|nr:hypothetical protein GCM10008110_25310 [Marinobacter persicus]SFJ82637.1 hypothetical protein SAMN05216429_106138 [Marinobacter persicus]